ncbi:2,3-diketo-L-gulonate-binding periplasmic protein YiaO precursor [Aquimixticola soesokkakensis]|uniref:2,3-diketo-L-gulonate-binding periplasmic protein YiaO n=1 Tax=Aquimixticola soesokkakensis TaxID=1519096 RepID=A0A1Y5RTI2_9RHOB|nr:TRAP transporter substrate-binding protein [Aquimixticola soesokkakensis]SLN23890.1 2,3-diketo-L-gulonate-binding periplasmic protein YiaO precursor [Aquimixticola soesokkakensis]
MTPMTKAVRRFVPALALAALVASPAFAKEWRTWAIHPDDYPNVVALNAFAEEVSAKTEGRVEPSVYANGILGAQPDAIEQVRSGALAVGNFNMGPMGEIVPATNVLSLPFIFRDEDQMHTAMDGEIGQQFSDALAEQGLVALSWFDGGSRSFYNTKRPIVTPADMEGLKFRVMNNDLYVQMVDELGGNATPMAYGEVYQSLKTGVIDGAENNYPSFDSSNHFEVAKYYSVTNHLIIPECICVSTTVWDDLDDTDKAIVKEAAMNAATIQRDLWAERSEASRAEVEAAGVEINEVSDPAAFQSAMEPIYARFISENPDLEQLIRDIQAVE